MPSQPSIVESRGIRREADDGTVLLAGVSLAIDAGTTTAIMGPPGSGKTLLLRAISLLDPLAAGEVRYRGESIADEDVPSVRRDVLLVPQQAVLVEGTVRENLELPFQFARSADKRFHDSFHHDRLEQMNREAAFLDQPIDDLSGGEQQIVALLRALQLGPTVLLLDEPTASLDEETTATVERLVNDWRHESAERALVIVTHKREQAERMTDRIVWMRDGRIIDNAEETPEETA